MCPKTPKKTYGKYRIVGATALDPQNKIKRIYSFGRGRGGGQGRGEGEGGGGKGGGHSFESGVATLPETDQ